MSKLVWDDAGGDTRGSTDLVQVEAQLANQGVPALGTSQQVAIEGQGIERTEETEALDEFTDEGVYGDHSFCLQLAERHVNRPTIRSDVTGTIPGKVDTFPDAHTGMAQQQEDIGWQIVAAE